MIKKTILLCGNGLSGEVIKYIKSWNYNVALISEFPEDIGVEYADYFVESNSKNPDQAWEATQKLLNRGCNINGVISLCWDCAISVSTIANKLGLFSVSIESAINSTQKNLRSEIFYNKNIPSPKFQTISNYNQLVNVIKNFKFPIILKPIDQSSSKGVIKVLKENDLKSAYEYAKSYSDSEIILLNEFLQGTEHSTEGLMIDGVFYLTAISDRVFDYKKYEPYFIEIGDIMPTRLSIEDQNKLSVLTQDAAISLGITNGVVKGDLLYTFDNEPFVLEISARLGGPRFGTEMVPLSNGTNILKAAIQQALNEEINLDLLKPNFNHGMVNRSIFPKPGIIKKILGLDSISKMHGFYDFKWWNRELKIGDKINEYNYGCGSVAYFIATGKSREDALNNADAIEKKIIIETIED